MTTPDMQERARNVYQWAWNQDERTIVDFIDAELQSAYAEGLKAGREKGCRAGLERTAEIAMTSADALYAIRRELDALERKER